MLQPTVGDAVDTELAAADATEQGLEELADMFATELIEQQQQQQQPSTTASRMRERSHRQLISIDFGSQDLHAAGNSHQGEGDEDLDLVTPPWLQPKTKAAQKDSRAPVEAGPAGAQSHAAAHTAAPVPAPAKQRTRAPQRTPPARAAPHTPVAPDSAGGDAAEQEQEQEQEQEEDGISCGNSSDDFEPPSCSRRLAAARAAVAGGSVGKKRRSSGSHRPAPAGAAGIAGTPASMGPAGPCAAAGRLLDSLLGPSPLQQGSVRGSMQQQAQWQQQQQQQQQQQADPHPGHADGSGQVWIPKYKQGLATQQAGFGVPSNTQQHQQQQQHWQQPADSSRRPPGLLERQQPAAAAAGGWHDPCMGMHGALGPCAGTAAGAGGDVSHAWWWVLPDFVPVEVLLQQQCNPRDSTPVYIHYKSQFKDGGSAAAAAPKGRRAANAATGAAGRQAKGKGRRGSAAAAAAVGGAGFLTASWLDQQQGEGGSSGGGRAKGRKRRSSKKGAKAAGAGSGGGKRKRGSGGGGRWSTVNGRKVFISNSGSRLTGASAYKAYKGL